MGKIKAMKTVLFLLFVCSFFACKKCADCTNSISYHKTETRNSDGYTLLDSTYSEGGNSAFEVCETENINNAEYHKQDTDYWATDGTTTWLQLKIADCNCVTK